MVWPPLDEEEVEVDDEVELDELVEEEVELELLLEEEDELDDEVDPPVLV